MNKKPIVGIVMGSNSDLDTMQHAAQMLEQFGVAHEAKVLSAHRMPDDMFQYAEKAQANGLQAIIAGAGGAAHLPGMLASKTIVPVYGVPVASKYLIGEAGAANAALHVIAGLALHDADLAKRLEDFRAKQSDAARSMNLPGY
jgi:5-(carboxyamino)imidazole ribonucleotide mutase